MWVTYRGGVYDVTDFRLIHPGGHIIAQAAGGDVAPFWDVWAYHHHAPSVGEYLVQLRIGALKGRDAAAAEEERTMGAGAGDDPYEAEPARAHAAQTIFLERPYCSETRSAALGKSYLTTADALYVRNHAPVPECAWPPEGASSALHAQQHEVCFDGAAFAGARTDEAEEEEASVFTVAELEARFGTVTVTSILQCAGNRASEDIAATGPSGFSGTPFERITHGMLGNAQWGGVRLADVLPALYPAACDAVRRHGGGEWHVVFEGADGYVCSFLSFAPLFLLLLITAHYSFVRRYSASTPLSRVLAHKNDCLLATRMNGEPLSPDHGYPARALLPGVAGARNVKWLHSISLQRRPVDAPWNAHYYKNAAAEQIQELPLQSLILDTRVANPIGAGSQGPQAKSAAAPPLEAVLEVSGVAYSGGSGNAIARVEISTNGGESWADATMHVAEVKEDGSHSHFGWVRWSASIPMRPGRAVGHGETSVCCRATDAEGITQREAPAKERGYVYNGWSKVNVVTHPPNGDGD